MRDTYSLLAWLACSAASLACASASSACLRAVMSRTAADTKVPCWVSIGLRLISTGNSLLSLRRPDNSIPAPMGRTSGSAR